MCQKRQKKSADTPVLTYASCSGTFSPTKNWYDSTKSEGSVFSVFDPVQGPVTDCYLIAALASMAWVKQDDLSRYGAGGNYRFKSGTINIGSMDVLYNNSVPAGAQFGPNNYYWPLWYEKAYAKLRNCPNWGSTTCPDVSQLGGDAGLQALIEVAWKYPRNNSPGFTIKYTKPEDINGMINSLNALTTPGGKALNPAVAWTATATNEIKSDHTYSYLGYVNKNSVYYIVLRNPCKVEPTPSGKLLTSGKWPNSQTGPIDFSQTSDGIFALRFQEITTDLTIGYVS
jgi:hypothetical protein